VDVVVINAGNANAATGAQGVSDVAETAARVGALLSCPPERVWVCSTGVIGQPLPMAGLLRALPQACDTRLGQGAAAAQAILTTDLCTKQITARAGPVLVQGIAKGSGMIHPNMATMLGFLAVNVRLSPTDAQAVLQAAVDRSFNALSVDGDTSTNDTVILLCTGSEPAPRRHVQDAVDAVCVELARAIAADGEGADHRIEVRVQGGGSDAEARRLARAVVRSPLVKCAVHGQDPNWGRVVGALGAAGARGLDTLDLDFAGVPVLRAGAPVPLDETQARAGLSAFDVRIHARLPGVGQGRAWGCDLSDRYVRINADYTS
jgi:glutamate N-acetyltransferase/amino-acid N-acetyltransferase